MSVGRIVAITLFIAALLGAGALGLWGLGDRPSPLRTWLRLGEKRQLNVILLTADTLRADKLACHGNPLIDTPHLDRLAASGVLFEDASTVTPLSLPDHYSILTSTYPMHHGVRDNGGYYLEEEQVTLADTSRRKVMPPAPS